MTRIIALAVVLAVVGMPAASAVAVALVAPPVLLGVRARLDLRAPRHADWGWRWWWWYGYRGLYQLDWFIRRATGEWPA